MRLVGWKHKLGVMEVNSLDTGVDMALLPGCIGRIVVFAAVVVAVIMVVVTIGITIGILSLELNQN